MATEGPQAEIKKVNNRVKKRDLRNMVFILYILLKKLKSPAEYAGEVGEAIRNGYRLPPPFRESVANRPNAGDLTRRPLRANLQLRDSVGFSPTSPRSGQYFVVFILCLFGRNVNAFDFEHKQRKKVLS